jgi:hypothetical protein
MCAAVAVVTDEQTGNISTSFPCAEMSVCTVNCKRVASHASVLAACSLAACLALPLLLRVLMPPCDLLLPN